MKKISLALLLAVLTLLSYAPLRADEGMWLAMLLGKLNEADMKAKGLKLSAEQIYSVNHSSLKDAIFGLGYGNPGSNFCTSEAISGEGLLLTNHHCAYDLIQSHSTPENNILEKGFLAATKAEELPNQGLTASFLVRMEDVTEKMKAAMANGTAYQVQQQIIEEATKDTHYKAIVKDFFFGSEFYLFVFETFRDVRLVAAPPEAVGKFGGDTDNWMWPRHTGDFALLRIYADKDNKPADYSPDNVPYKPKHFLPVSVKGIQEGDFAMTFGFPGRTERYKTSHSLLVDFEKSNPARIKLRENRLNLMKEAMDKDPRVRLMYAAKYAQISNYYKYFIGQNEGLARLKTVDLKRQNEAKFQEWADKSGEERYATALKRIEEAQKAITEYQLSYIYLQEAAFGAEFMELAYEFYDLYDILKAGNDAKEAAAAKEAAIQAHFEEYNAAIDKRVFAKLFSFYAQDVPKSQQPPLFESLVAKKYKGNWDKYADKIFASSFLTSKERALAFAKNPSLKAMESDLGFSLFLDVFNNYRQKIAPAIGQSQGALTAAMRDYVEGLRAMQTDKVFYPDANSTLRLSYGTVRDYAPKDGVQFRYFTTHKGILEKENPNDAEFVVPAKVKELIQKKDFGTYADKNGNLPVAFITDNDITGGNSGSPVIGAEGELIGLAFDGNWEAMTGDLVYDAEYKRCINVDIRYVLWTIEKVLGGERLIQEMTLVR
jgi:hypothetical protein